MTVNTKVNIIVLLIFSILIFVFSKGEISSILSTALKLLPIVLMIYIPMVLARKYMNKDKDGNEDEKRNSDYDLKL